MRYAREGPCPGALAPQASRRCLTSAELARSVPFSSTRGRRGPTGPSYGRSAGPRQSWESERHWASAQGDDQPASGRGAFRPFCSGPNGARASRFQPRSRGARWTAGGYASRRRAIPLTGTANLKRVGTVGEANPCSSPSAAPVDCTIRRVSEVLLGNGNTSWQRAHEIRSWLPILQPDGGSNTHYTEENRE